MNRLVLLISLLLSIGLTACGEPERIVPPTDNGQTGKDDNNNPPSEGGAGRYLVVYASRSGNTRSVAQLIQSTLGCDILEVNPTTPYENDYNAMLERAQREQREIEQGSYPSIETSVENFDAYDTVFVGYPIWYGHMATPMQTFLHRNAAKLSGKTIALFATSGSSGISTSADDARNLCVDSAFTPTLLLTSGSIAQMQSRVTDWLASVGAEKETTNNNSMKIKMTVGARVLTATMVDNPTTRDLLSRLPIEVTMSDYAGAEKIFTPSPALTTQGTTLGHNNPAIGDIDLYAPWGNIAIFYKTVAPNGQLVNLGHIDDNGVEVLNVSGSVTVKIERQ